MEQARPRGEPAPDQTSPTADDAADVARVAQLVARAGLRLTTDEIAQLVAEYRYDRRGFDRMRTMLVAEDETAHSFRAARVMRPPTRADEARAGDAMGDADAEAAR